MLREKSAPRPIERCSTLPSCPEISLCRALFAKMVSIDRRKPAATEICQADLYPMKAKRTWFGSPEERSKVNGMLRWTLMVVKYDIVA